MQNITLPNITSLRFFLALLVILYHIPQFSANRGFASFADFPLFQKGAEAVYVFFSLSGFLIIRNLFIEKEKTGKISITDFYQRRVLRIFPLYYAVFIFGIVYYNWLLPALGMLPNEAGVSLWKQILLGATFFANVLAKYQPGGIIEILWSIAIEEQFYLFVAPLLFLLPLKRIVLFLVGFTAIYFYIYNWNIWNFATENKLYFYYFSMSGFVAILHYRYPKIRGGTVLLLISAILFLSYFFTNFWVEHLSVAAYQFFGMSVSSLFIFSFINRPISFFENPALKYLGKISYGIYMVHTIVMQLIGLFFLKIHHYFSDLLFIILFNILVILGTVLMAHFSYKYFESYFLKQKKRLWN